MAQENVTYYGEEYRYAATGTYGGALPRERERVPEYVPEIEIPQEETQPVAIPRRRVREQVSYPTVVAFMVIAAMAAMFIWVQCLYMVEATALNGYLNVYSGDGKLIGKDAGLTIQLNDLREEQRQLTAEFERVFDMATVRRIAIEQLDMVADHAYTENVAKPDYAEIPAGAETDGSGNILDRILGFFGIVS
ncbi:MAG: hypothetical protein LBN02_03095 [Oscillospiraceae bacterium]|jgi:hypothetical protein|nr:hypothetical protein [Oscillospiraceae bacterium]